MLPTPTPQADRLPAAADGVDGTQPGDNRLERASEQGREALQRFSHEAETFAVRSAAQIRRQAAAVQAMTAQEVQTHPLRPLLLAAGAGVALTLLLRLLLRR